MSAGIGAAGTRDAVLQAVRRLMGPGAAEPCIVDTHARQTGTTAEGHAICEVVSAMADGASITRAASRAGVSESAGVKRAKELGLPVRSKGAKGFSGLRSIYGNGRGRE